jgi:hypothetical protein
MKIGNGFSSDGMIFETNDLNTINMKKIAFIVSALFLLTACSSTKDMSSNKSESKKNKKLAEIEDIKKAIESRKFVIKVDRIYMTGGGNEHMKPDANFFILNGEIASISLGYIGRSYTSRPISGINVNGQTISYEMESDQAKGKYEIRMVVKNKSDKFDVYLTIGNEGFCSLSLNNAYIQSVRYSGNLIPLYQYKYIPVDKGDRM